MTPPWAERGVEGLWDSELWWRPLERFALVGRLTVTLFDAEGKQRLGPVHATPLHAFFTQSGYDPGLANSCARACLAGGGEPDSAHRSESGLRAVEVGVSSAESGTGLAVVGTSLELEGEVVGAAVGGYMLTQFATDAEIERLARRGRLSFERLWQLVRQERPLSRERIVQTGELLQALGDGLLRQAGRARQCEWMAAQRRAERRAQGEFMGLLARELRSGLSSAELGRLAAALEELSRARQGQIALEPAPLDLGALASEAAAARVRADVETTRRALDLALGAAIRSAPEASHVWVQYRSRVGGGAVEITYPNQGAFRLLGGEEYPGPGHSADMALARGLLEMQGGELAVSHGHDRTRFELRV